MIEENEEVIEREEVAPEADEPEHREGRQEPATDPEIEREAAKWGWSPKDKWQGDPAEHRPAEDFLNDPRTQRRIREASDKRFEEQEARHNEKVAALERTANLANKRIAELEKGGHETQVSDLQRRIEAAAESGDLDEVRRLTGELTKVTPPAPEPQEQADTAGDAPEVQAFIKRNPWFNTDRALNMEAQAIHMRLQDEHPHMPLAENMKRVEEEIKGRYPEKFGITNGTGKPREERVQKVAGSEARGGGGGGGARSFSAIPAADREVARKHYIGKDNVFKSEKDYARSYWSEFGED